MISSTNKKYFLLAVSGSKIGKSTDMDIAVRCPICGDSKKNRNSTRLHLFHKNNKDGIKCFNGDCELNNGVYTVYGFLKNFFPRFLDTYKMETFGNRMQQLEGDVFADIVQNKIEQPKQPILTHNLFSYFSDILNHDEAIAYLQKRGFNYFTLPFNWYFGTQDLKIGDKLYKLTNNIIIPLYYGDDMYGFYSRNIYNKEFFTYNPEQNIGYKIWNWFEIDKDREVLITEGIFDSLSINYDNKIACMSAKIPQERLDELKEPIFVLDNDTTGIKNSIYYAQRGYKVYVQPDKYREKDLNELMINNPSLDIYKLIKENVYTGISAIVRLKSKL